MMKRGIGCLGCLPFCVFCVVMLLVGAGQGFTGIQVKSNTLSPKVLMYQDTLTHYAKEQGIGEYVPYLLAIMEVESKGEGVDPMQSSESIDGKIGNITTPDDSIKQGVIHFKTMLDKAKGYQTDIWTVVQAYNYGGGFIDYVGNRPWSFELAEQFSHAQSNGKKVDYVNAISTQKGYAYRYDYGNMFYVLLVQPYLTRHSLQTHTGLSLPLDNPTVTSYFGEHRELTLQDGRRYESVHRGIDMVNGQERAPIKVAAQGKVVYSGYRDDTGLTVIVEHGTLYTYYFHLSVIMVTQDEQVEQGQHIGVIGSSGYSTGTHLHFGVSQTLWADYVDPMPLLQELTDKR
ncbi:MULTISPECIES: lysozyme family protein [unclassified Granulicatella]|uniref:lysozyme family protein n=1 Tax=unclassified Granulicatella TaxID=2630493 RepID=UPI00107306B5|nr:MULTISPECIES: lysozyme family protein [unclassified Granulicatella]MBF0780666.1 lysozyme family protein [Granulicatella sp. 19428wC4_WM01]TFU94243.1 hypothetical protein E4T68_06110 [Granulicatella sp. WM01]